MGSWEGVSTAKRGSTCGTAMWGERTLTGLGDLPVPEGLWEHVEPVKRKGECRTRKPCALVAKWFSMGVQVNKCSAVIHVY